MAARCRYWFGTRCGTPRRPSLPKLRGFLFRHDLCQSKIGEMKLNVPAVQSSQERLGVWYPQGLMLAGAKLQGGEPTWRGAAQDLHALDRVVVLVVIVETPQGNNCSRATPHLVRYYASVCPTVIDQEITTWLFGNPICRLKPSRHYKACKYAMHAKRLSIEWCEQNNKRMTELQPIQSKQRGK